MIGWHHQLDEHEFEQAPGVYDGHISLCSQAWKRKSNRTGKGQFLFQSQRKAMPKNAQTITQLYSSHTLVK